MSTPLTSSTSGVERSSFRAVLRNSSFMYLWIGQILSQLADKVFFVYLIVMLVAAGHSANSDVSRLTLVNTIPAVIFGSLAGVFVDRWNKKWLMVISNLLRGIFILALPLAAYFGGHSILWIYTITFLVSTATQFFAPAEVSMIPTIIDKKNLLAANSLFTTTMLASVVIGFAVGEPILSAVGDDVGHWAIAIMYFAASIFLLWVRPRFQPDAPAKSGASIVSELKEGFGYLRSERRILIALVRMILLYSAFAALTILVIGFVEDVLRLDKRYFGYILATAGVGMGIGAGVVGRLGHLVSKDKLIFTGFLSMGSLLIGIANIHVISGLFNAASRGNQASSTEVALALVMACFLGVAAAAIAIPLQTLLQEEIPEHLRGKVFGVQNMLVNTALTVPMLLAGVSADLVDQWLPGYGVVVVMSLLGLLLLIGGFVEKQMIKGSHSGNI